MFESRFESGNLAAVTKVGENDYHMLLQNDVNTGGHTQWFFFRVNNVVMGEVRFNMLNLCKPDSLYNEGMKSYAIRSKLIYIPNSFPSTQVNDSAQCARLAGTKSLSVLRK